MIGGEVWLGKINRLSQEVISHISANEVILDPSSVVKELVENSIDSGATIISIYIENGGKDRIVVSDNGYGMAEEDIPKSLEHHSTSKISELKHLFQLNTMGFRGEALSSMATVSKVTVQSAINNDGVGYKYVVAGGEVIDPLHPFGCPKGTLVIVDQLFFNTIPRKKQLKGVRTEAKKIIDLVGKYALIHPNISFRLEQSGKSYLTTRGGLEMIEVLPVVYGKDDLKSFKKIFYQDENITINGYITNVTGARKTRKNQTIAVNKRIIQNGSLYKAAEDSVRKYIPPGIYPQFVLDISVSPQILDCNIHPSKAEIRIINEEEIHSKLLEVVSEVLKEERVIEIHELEEVPLREALLEKEDYNSFEVIGQLKDTYILVEINNKLLIVDQHAAHESILYHYMKDDISIHNKALESIEVDTPVILNLSPFQEEMLVKHNEVLGQLGFELEDFGHGSYIVRKMPSKMKLGVVKETLEEMLSKTRLSATEWLTEALTMASCRSAIKANEKLSQETMEEIVAEMVGNMLTNCPHGRPLYISTGVTDLHKQFKRIL